jgi:hypothetical protein
MTNPVRQLRNHIPIGGPARREPADGTEEIMRVSLGFEPGWYTNRCSVDFSEKFHKDPHFRYQNIGLMKNELVTAFPSVPNWDIDDMADMATISGCYGAYPIPYAFGIPLIFRKDRGPVLNPEARLGIDEIENLSVDSVLNGPVVENILRQMDIIESEWGMIHGYLNWQGVLNNAFNIRGQDIFMDLYERPQFAHHFFALITEVMIGLARIVQERQRKSGFPVNQFSVSNCVMNMISPEMYEEFIFPHDTMIADSFDRFGVHTCEWDITPYIDVLKKLPKMGYLDMGTGSDMDRVRHEFPEARRAVLYSPVKLENADLDTIEKDMDMIFRNLSPCDVVLAEIQYNTPDEKICDVLRICRERSE